MTATTPEKTSTRPAPVEYLPQQEIDYSCRNPLLFLFTAGMIWLIFSLVTGILASIKMHAPGMLADSAALTYGRVAAVSSNAFFYGFASQVAIGVALWLGKTFLVLPRCGLVAAIIWNIGVALGILGIFAGGMSQHRLFEMPAWTALIFFVSFVVLGISGILTFNARNEREVYPTNWYLLAAFFAFPWIISVAYLLLGRYPVRGVLEPTF
jgi:cytochrome c oxidase cbb3-type subunit I